MKKRVFLLGLMLMSVLCGCGYRDRHDAEMVTEDDAGRVVIHIGGTGDKQGRAAPPTVIEIYPAPEGTSGGTQIVLSFE